MKFRRIFIFVHDGIYCAQTGAGMSNYRFIQSLIKLGYGDKLTVCPVFTSALNADFHREWYNRSKKLILSSGGIINPVQNGSRGTVRYGDLSYWKLGCEYACKKIILDRQEGKTKDLIISFDTPFIALIELLSNKSGLVHIHVPRSSGLLHDPKNIKRIDFEKNCFKVANQSINTYVGATGNFMKKHLTTDYSVKNNKIFDITNGVLLDSYKKYKKSFITNSLRCLKINTNKPFILAYGRAAEYKGFDILVNALGKIKEGSRPQLVLIATTHDEKSAYISQLNSLMKVNKIEGILLTKFDADLPLVLQQAPNIKAIVVPSRSEPFGLIPLEVFANPFTSVPVIASDAGGLRDLVIKDKTGFVFGNGKVDELADQLNKVMSLTDTKKAVMKSKSKLFVEQNYNYLENIRIFLQEISNIA